MRRMKLSVTRLDAQGRYETTIARDDGVRFRMRGPDCTFAIPHDIAHFVVEKALQLERGFWGRVAAGGVFSSMSYLDGRRRPRAAEQSKSVLTANPAELSEAEVLVRIFCETIQEGHNETAPILIHRLKDRRVAGKPQVSSAEIAVIFAEYRRFQTRWSDLPVGGSIELEW